MSLEAQKLGVAFDRDWVFRDLSISVTCGDRLTLIGDSGSGKSLLLKCLAMLHRIDEGSVLFNGSAISGSAVPDFRSKVMYLPQRSADVDGNVEDFIRIPFSFAANSRKRYQNERVIAFLDSLARDESFLQKTQRELSGGERQIASLIRALLLAPEFLLLDEPTSAMDAAMARRVESLVDRWVEEDSARAFMWVTHDMDQAERISSRTIRISEL